MKGIGPRVFFWGSLILLLSCQTRWLRFQADELGMEMEFPHTMTLCAEQELLLPYLRHSQEAVTKPVVALLSHRTGRLVFAIHPFDTPAVQTAEDFFYSVVTGSLGDAEVVEPIQMIEIGGRSFHTVEFVQRRGATLERHRLYQFYHPESGRALLISATANIRYWEQEISRLHQVVSTLKLKW